MTTNALSMLSRLVGSTPPTTVAIVGGTLVGLAFFSLIMLGFWLTQRRRERPHPVIVTPQPAMPSLSVLETGPASAVVIPTVIMRAISMPEEGGTLMGLGVHAEELAEELALRQALRKKSLSTTQRL